MKPLFGIVGLLLVLLTTGAGYYIGKNSVSEHSLQAAVHTHSDKTDASPNILYYRNPMGLADTSPIPKKDSMGMDYLPVYENEVSQSSDLVRIDSHKIQTLGVQTHTVKEQLIGRDIRALGTLEIDQAKLSDISPRFEGWVTDLLVNTEGQRVAKGEILFSTIIPNLYYAEFAYKQAVKKTLDVATAAPDVQRQAELQVIAAMERLEEIGAPLDEMERLQRGGEPFTQISYRSPASGVVLQKNVVQGTRFVAGDRLYQVADLSKLWLVIQLPEQELSTIKTGDPLRVELLSEPGNYRKTKVDFIYPNLDTTNRSIKVRATLDNSDYKLKPGQSAEVWLQSQPHKALTIPANALLDSGHQQWVLVALSEGVYQPRTIEVGERNLDWIEVTSGLNADENVVTNANFLIDSESRLQAALANFDQPTSTTPTTENSTKQSEKSPAAEHDHSNHAHSHTEH